MSDLEKVSRLKEQVESLRSEVDRAKGALSSTIRQLKEDFGCDSLEEGRKKLAHLQRSREERAKRVEKARERFERKWGDLLR